MTASPLTPLAPPSSRAPQRDFRPWVEATAAPEELSLGLDGFSYADLYQPTRLAELTERFRAFLREQDAAAADGLAALEQGGGTLATPAATSNAYIAAAAHLSTFVARLFRVENEVAALRASLLSHDPIWAFKREFVKKRVLKADAGKGAEEPARVARLALAAAGVDQALLGAGSDDEELAIARATLRLLEIDDTARKIAKAGGASWRPELGALASAVASALESDPVARQAVVASLEVKDDPGAPHLRPGAVAEAALKAIEGWLASRGRDHHDPAHLWSSLREPRKLDFQNLVQIRRPEPKLPDLFVGPEHHRRDRDGFALTDARGMPRQIQSEVDYCLYCHDRDKDSCSKGLRDAKTGAIKPNPLGVPLQGCPLDEKISEMHLLRQQGDALGALALVCIDNPMCTGTGHRICNDCMKACVFQKQEPVNIPQIETATLTDVLALPWGVEIYGLLTRWNPLNVRLPHPAPLNGRSALVVGLGPAGYTLAHHLSRAGFAVAGVDGLKVEPLPVELTGDEGRAPRPIRDFKRLCVDLDERIVLGFGGVSEYGITVRWDKNFLTLAYLTLARNRRIRLYGGVRFGGTMTIEDAWKLGFDHVALAAGAGRPTIIPLKNNMARGIRKASDFLMGLQLSGAYKPSSLANLQIRLPAIVIGGGLTAIDTATELLAYYVIQVEKTAARYRALVSEQGEAAVRATFDAEELAFLDEQLRHADAVAEERRRAGEQGRAPSFQGLLDGWGGVSIAYRKSVLDSPAYRLNHEEVEKSLEEGVRYLENLSPLEAVLDPGGALTSVKFERFATGEDGKWKSTGEVVDLPARTLCVAAGTSPNTTFEKENPGIFALDARKQFFQAHEASRDEQGAVTLTPAKDTAQAFFTSYSDGSDRTVSFYGDNHPYYAGSVVKAMASAKVGFEKVAALYQDRAAVDDAERARRRERIATLFRDLDEQLIATVHDVIRLTPTIVEVIIHAPLAARNFQPGQFYRLQNYEFNAPIVEGTRLAMEGLALTGAWVDKEKGLMSTIVLEMGASSRLCAMLRKGERVSLMGPTGTPTEIPASTTALLAGGGLGNAVLFSIARAMKEKGTQVIYFAGYRKGEDLFHQGDIEASTDQVIWCTDSGVEITPRRPQDSHFRGNIVQAMIAFAKGELGPKVAELSSVSRIIAIGSDRMMAAVQQARHGVLAPHLDRRHIGIGSINSPMQCMMKEICAQCLQKHRDPVTGKEFMVFSCNNQDQELDLVDFQHLQQRLRANSAQEKLADHWLNALLARHPEIERI
ncbi:MAG: FAD-dependent oxidoreductase [Polyangiaceae bacterium]|nr:FAD-dependent oxidoreductase [Polyangiaceae bacterium]